MTDTIKKKILAKLIHDRANQQSDAKHARIIGIDKAQYSRIKKGELEVLSKAKWISLARLLNVELGDKKPWNIVKTETYNYITTQLKMCQDNSVCRIFCDNSGIGKTVAGKKYADQNENAVYIDCSQVKSKQKLIRKIAQELGVGFTGRYVDVYQDLVYYIRSTQNILIILDEAGDLEYTGFLELKALENATTQICGWYMMGADGLKHKFTRQKDLNKVGYTEVLDRYGNDYKKVTPDGKEALKEFHLNQIALISKANGSKITPLKMYAKTKGSLRSVRVEILKQQIA